jgi:hypothetical protein
LSDLFADRQALRHHAEGKQDWTTTAMTNRAWQDGFVAMARLERCVPGRHCFHAPGHSRIDDLHGPVAAPSA